ncbi:MAG: SDR family oxidoreductase [Verrucomicrobiota bacterium]
MNIDLSGQQVVVTGAANGIGSAIVHQFIESGASVTAVDVDSEALSDLSSAFSERLTQKVLDITDLAGLTVLASKLEIDHLVCAAAVGSGKGGFPFWNLEPSDWDRVLDVTLMGTVRTLHTFVPPLLRGDTDRKSVSLIASVAGQIGSQTDPPYSAAKAALINFAQCAAKDFAEYGIRVNTISPGMVQTKLNQSVFEANRGSKEKTFEEWGREKVLQVSPLGRWQEASEIAAMTVYLASEFARNVTGQTLNVDGGQVMHS